MTALPPCITPSWVKRSINALPNSAVPIFHPITGRAFLSFTAQPYPIQGGFSLVGGIPRSLVIDACRILTGTYTESVFICPKNDPSSSFEFEFLPAGGYVYVVGSLDRSANYGVYNDFHTWNPPFRAQVPDYWFTAQFPRVATLDFGHPWEVHQWPNQADMHSVMSKEAKNLDLNTCCLSLVESTSVEGCHVVPVEEKVFYTARGIYFQLLPDRPVPIGLRDEQTIHDIRNFITLRRTIHRLWNTNIMGFYPLSAGSYVAYFFVADGNAALFHLNQLHLPEHTDPYLMYVRFALTVFKFRLGTYKGDQPDNALLSCVPENPNKRKARDSSSSAVDPSRRRGGGGGGGSIIAGIDSQDDIGSIGDSGMVDESSSNDGIPPFVFDLLTEEVEAKGMMLSEDLQALAGHHYPEVEETRIKNVVMEYLESHPEVGMSTDQRTV